MPYAAPCERRLFVAFVAALAASCGDASALDESISADDVQDEQSVFAYCPEGCVNALGFESTCMNCYVRPSCEQSSDDTLSRDQRVATQMYLKIAPRDLRYAGVPANQVDARLAQIGGFCRDGCAIGTSTFSYKYFLRGNLGPYCAPACQVKSCE